MNRALALVLALVAVGCSPAAAQAPACAPHGEITAVLASNYGEHSIAQGIAANGALMEIFASENTGTWTIAVTGSDGITCLIASGTDLGEIPNA